MATKGPRSKLDHETRARRQKALEAPKEPPRPKAHWDHVLEEMVWLSKDFEAERKWKLAQAKKVAIRASKSIMDQATRGERKVKEEEQRLRKVALNISKDIKKFWVKVEKLVCYKRQLELEEKKKKALDKQLDFLLGQTERYSTMLAENLLGKPLYLGPASEDNTLEQTGDLDGEKGPHVSAREPENQPSDMENDDDYGIQPTDELDDDERTIEEDEAHITEKERKDEVAALQNEADMPLEELLMLYGVKEASRVDSPEVNEDVVEKDLDREDQKKDAWKQVNGSQIDLDDVSYPQANGYCHCIDELASHSCGHDSSCLYHRESNGNLSTHGNMKETGSRLDDSNIVDDEYFPRVSDDELDDEATMAEEEELSKSENVNFQEEITLLQQESEISIEELLSRYKKDARDDVDDGISESENASSTDEAHLAAPQDIQYEILADLQMGKSDDLQSGYAAQVRLENFAELKSKNPADVLPEKPVDFQSEYPDRSSLENSAELDSENLVEMKEGHAAEEREIDHGRTLEGRDSEDIIAGAAAAAMSAQPTGNTFLTTNVRTKFPFLLKYPLREYQHIGLDWLVTMYEKRLNGILADEMGLGKTIMAIALLAHLACEKGIWGPHLIVVPTSVMLNWETEFLKWSPAFKILTYFGSAKERKNKRQGWLKPNSFHICITTYRLVIQDSKVFKRKKWKYLILDEAHLIKNWKSQRWQTLLNFNSKRRILLTGTPLQNDLMELWSLMHFLMPHIFQSHQEFKDWFCNPISEMVEGQEKVNKDVVDRLHNVLRPFILRRLKRDVEKQLPKKHEHVVFCRLSKRQRNLYEDFISSSETQATLASANYFGMISVIMQLRKVCNHPDLFEGRPIVSAFDMTGIDMQISSSVCSVLASCPFTEVDLVGLNFVFTQNDFNMTAWEVEDVAALSCPMSSITDGEIETSDTVSAWCEEFPRRKSTQGSNFFDEIQRALWDDRMCREKERTARIAWWNFLQCSKKPVYGTDLREVVTVKHPVLDIHEVKQNPSSYLKFSSKLADVILSPLERMELMLDLIESFTFAIPAARAPPPICWCSKRSSPVLLQPACKERYAKAFSPLLSPFRPAIVRRQVYFPDRRLLQFDCGKLQELAVLLRRLKKEGHRALIFTQMTRMLDILEAFINLYGYTYMRLDGSTQPEERQTLMQRFNTNPKIFLFILSTRSGGVGVNLVGADTVIFYDSDWNPAMDQQAQDRCHRIGQTREVHIYRLITESTIEENILKKANQKRALDDLVIQSGSYNTEFFKKLDPIELFSGHRVLPTKSLGTGSSPATECSAVAMEAELTNADVEAAIEQAEDEADYMALKKVQQEEAVDNQEFAEETVVRPEEDELAMEDDARPDERLSEEPHITATQGNSNDVTMAADYVNEETAIVLAGQDEDDDMLADVKQMAAAAAAAGHASSSFENHLRPIDRYAMRFLELWDPIIDKSAIDIQTNFEGEEWELDRIEKFKEDLEAEIDEDQEPLVYERWDTDFATTAYRQHVEALAQRQMIEELERQLQQPCDDDDEPTGNRTTIEGKPKSKKKSKKKKFKSLKKGAVASELEAVLDDQEIDLMILDDTYPVDFDYSSDSPAHSPPIKKRKKAIFSQEDEKYFGRVLKKHKKPRILNPVMDLNLSGKQLLDVGNTKKPGEVVTGFELKHASKGKTSGKIAITLMPVKRVIVVKPEKLKKRGHVWSSDCFPSPDSWSSQEDAILCASVHEYSTNWALASDILYSFPGGGFYRGRYRHPVHCCERFRELFFKYVMPATDNSNTLKVNTSGTGKALLKVSEDHIRILLNVTSEVPDNELLLEKHFTSILASVWRAKCCLEQSQGFVSSLNHYRSSSFRSNSTLKKPRQLTELMNLISLRQSSRMVATALMDADKKLDDESLIPRRPEPLTNLDKLDLRLDIPQALDGTMLSVVNVTIHAPKSPVLPDEPHEGVLLSESSCKSAENRFRLDSEALYNCEGSVCTSSAFRTLDFVRYRSGSRSQNLGKHKPGSDLAKHPKSKMPRTTEPEHEFATGRNASEDLTEWLTSVKLEGDESDDLFQCSTSGVPYQDQENTSLHEYDPNFIADLDDLGPFVDLTDIG